jgi:hypothetical protein
MSSNNTDSSGIEKYYKNSHAIIIGISNYKEETPLANAYNDAAAIKRVLQEKYDFKNVTTLFNEEATGEKIREMLQDTLRDESRIGHKDRVLIYYSGHGKLRRDIDVGGEERNTGYIIPYDSRLGRYGSSIEMDDLIRSVQGCKAKHILLILDCCYSGFAATREGQPKVPPKNIDKNYLDDITQRKAIQVLAATQKDEPANDSGILPGYSAFTGALLGILKNEKDPIENGVITASEIGTVLQQEVVNQKGVFQRPTYNTLAGSEGGDFIFKVLPTAATNQDKIPSNSSTEPIKGGSILKGGGKSYHATEPIKIKSMFLNKKTFLVGAAAFMLVFVLYIIIAPILIEPSLSVEDFSNYTKVTMYDRNNVWAIDLDNITVDWGDQSQRSIQSNFPFIHRYSKPDLYTIDVKVYRFNNEILSRSLPLDLPPG